MYYYIYYIHIKMWIIVTLILAKLYSFAWKIDKCIIGRYFNNIIHDFNIIIICDCDQLWVYFVIEHSYSIVILWSKFKISAIVYFLLIGYEISHLKHQYLIVTFLNNDILILNRESLAVNVTYYLYKIILKLMILINHVNNSVLCNV